MSTPKTAGEAAFAVMVGYDWNQQSYDYKNVWDEAAKKAIAWHESKKPKVRLCVECKHHTEGYCNANHIDLVTGKPTGRLSAGFCRDCIEDQCGPDGKMWEAK